MTSFQSFAIVPAAGTGQRMGTEKLLLPWHGRPLIEHVLAAWIASTVSRVAVVIRAADTRLESSCRRLDVDIVVPQQLPPEMKDSVVAALRHIHQAYRPSAADVWLLAPADMPQLSGDVVDRLLAAHDPQVPHIIVPAHAGRRGHPALFPWSMFDKVMQLRPHEGVDVLLRSCGVREIPVEISTIDQDIDTPADYRRLLDSDVG